ncbi:MAG: ParB/RepB/Spo0J family partition protein [bacterium]
MSISHKGLGRGLGSLIPNKINPAIDADAMRGAAINECQKMNNDFAETENRDIQFANIDTAKGLRVIDVPIEKIAPNPYQPRVNFDYESLEELIKSIKEHGILQPLVVSKTAGDGYELIAGERRLRAANLAELKTVPVIVREADNQKKLELALIENIQRKNLNAIEEANSYKRLATEFNLTQEEVSKKTGKSLAVIANTLRLLTLPKEIQDALLEGRIDKSAARTIAGLDSEEERLNLFHELIERGINVRQLENYVKRKKATRYGKKISLIDADTEEKKDMLQAMLGTKVLIDKKGGKGKIGIEFYSEEELSSLVNKICKLG